ncbi:MAG: hypothetical protein ABIA37_00285 [Candidatus Woesearchaeota archaeon]
MIKKSWRIIRGIRNYFKKSVKKRIIGEGLFAGFLTGITIRTGYELDRGGFFLKLADLFCQKTHGFENHLDCTSFISILSILIVVLTVLFLWIEIRKLKDRRILGLKFKGWLIGILIYLLSFSAALFLMLQI